MLFKACTFIGFLFVCLELVVAFIIPSSSRRNNRYFSKNNIESSNNNDLNQDEIEFLNEDQLLEIWFQSGQDKSLFNDTQVITSDEYLYQVSYKKQKITENILTNIKESSIDCNVYPNNKEDLTCFSLGKDDDVNVTICDFSDIDTHQADDDVIDALNLVGAGTSGITTAKFHALSTVAKRLSSSSFKKSKK